jgi:hypothetical protein
LSHILAKVDRVIQITAVACRTRTIEALEDRRREVLELEAVGDGHPHRHDLDRPAALGDGVPAPAA